MAPVVGHTLFLLVLVLSLVVVVVVLALLLSAIALALMSVGVGVRMVVWGVASRCRVNIVDVGVVSDSVVGFGWCWCC